MSNVSVKRFQVKPVARKNESRKMVSSSPVPKRSLAMARAATPSKLKRFSSTLVASSHFFVNPALYTEALPFGDAAMRSMRVLKVAL